MQGYIPGAVHAYVCMCQAVHRCTGSDKVIRPSRGLLACIAMSSLCPHRLIIQQQRSKRDVRADDDDAGDILVFKC